MAAEFGLGTSSHMCYSELWVPLRSQPLSDGWVYSWPTEFMLLFILQRDGSPVSMVSTERQLALVVGWARGHGVSNAHLILSQLRGTYVHWKSFPVRKSAHA